MEIKARKSEETKNRIMVSAQKLFHKKGFEAASVREIVEDAGCAKGTFYLYFETKMDLLIFIANKLFSSFNDIISAELSTVNDDPFLQIDNVLNQLYIHMQEKEGNLKLFHSREMLELIMEQKITNEFINIGIAQIAKFLQEGIVGGNFRAVDPVLYGKMIFSMGHEMLESAMLYKFPGDVEVVKSELMVIIRKILEK